MEQKRQGAIDFYEFMKSSIYTSQLEIDECLLVNYKCWETGSNKVWFKTSHFVFVLSGEKRWQYGEEMFHAVKGDVIFVKQGASVVHHSNSSEFCALIIFIPNEFASKFIRANNFKLVQDKSSVTSVPIQKVAPDIVLDGYKNSLLTYLAEKQLDNEAIAKVKLNELLIYIFSHNKYSDVANYFKSLTNVNEHQVRYIMEGNFMLPLNIDQYAEMCNMSVSTFKRKFNEIYDCSPGVWILEERLTLSKKLLLSSDMTIAEISDACGFNSTSYFVKAFKKSNGLTPLNFRKNN